ncbi:potassium efflux protein KefA, partial [Pasteurella multocida subsp. multocida str. Anand1_buffalo]
QQVAFSAQEKASLDSILQERRKLLSDIISLLNNQLNLVINIELNQKQVALISDQLQSKLQQQSFWVKSNAPM